MANDDTPAGFLGRWSRRKAEVREGKPVADPVPASVRVMTPVQALNDSTPDPQTQTPATPAPTLDDVQSLTPESDYTPFMARGVTSDVKNAAMKKLFTDPHFNVMDRMDVYIDDYDQPDPIPLAMLRQMNGAKFLNLFDQGTEAPVTTTAGDLQKHATSQLMAQSPPASPLSPTDTTTHDHADLRLQPDPTPRPEGTGPEPA
jgi:hypothetical protein